MSNMSQEVDSSDFNPDDVPQAASYDTPKQLKEVRHLDQFVSLQFLAKTNLSNVATMP